MTLSIKDPEVDRLARKVAKNMHVTITQAVAAALEEKLERQKRQHRKSNLAERLVEIGRRCAAMPVLDNRSEDEILGYDEYGIPSR